MKENEKTVSHDLLSPLISNQYSMRILIKENSCFSLSFHEFSTSNLSDYSQYNAAVDKMQAGIVLDSSISVTRDQGSIRILYYFNISNNR